MRRLFAILTSLLFFSCDGNLSNHPDVSDIKVTLEVKRFEQDLFSMDSLKLITGIDSLIKAYPTFGESFFLDVMNCDPNWGKDTLVNYIHDFTSSAAYKNLYDSAEKLYKDFTPYKKDIEKALQYQKYYFPKYKTPEKIITYIGPLDGSGDGLTYDGFAIGLQHHLGGGSSFYQSEWIQSTYPNYVTNHFDADHIVINCMNRMITDMYPDNFEESPLITQMIEKGKRLYILQALLPDKPEYQLINYSQAQLKDCYAHEDIIWNYFTQNNLLQSTDYNQIKNYVSEGPKTQELGEASPGNMGSWVGWQIVKKFMKKKSKLSLEALMKTDAGDVLNTARYKP
jgi:hypothetical protein